MHFVRGLIAEEVAKVFPDLVIYDDDGKPLTVRYHLLSSLLLNEVQKLQTRFEGEAGEHRKLAGRVAELEAREEAVAAQQQELAALAARLEARLDGPKWRSSTTPRKRGIEMKPITATLSRENPIRRARSTHSVALCGTAKGRSVKALRAILLATIAFALIASAATAQTSRVFVTSTTTNGNMGGLAGGDAICDAQASAASLGGTWVAWLSTSTVDAKDRLAPGSGPFVRAAGTPGTIANDIADLTDSSLAIEILNDENGNVVDTDVYTGTLSDGTAASVTCNEWTDGAGSVIFGHSNRSNGAWTERFQFSCNPQRHIFCFEVSTPAPVPAASPVGVALLAGLMLAGIAYFRLRHGTA